MEFPTQFNPKKFDSEKKALLSKKYSQPVGGFQRGLCESLSRLVQRLTVGQSVPMISSGVYDQDQIFDSEMVDRFDVLDRQNELLEEIGKERNRKAAEKSEDNGETSPDVSNPE